MFSECFGPVVEVVVRVQPVFPGPPGLLIHRVSGRNGGRTAAGFLEFRPIKPKFDHLCSQTWKQCVFLIFGSLKVMLCTSPQQEYGGREGRWGHRLACQTTLSGLPRIFFLGG